MMNKLLLLSLMGLYFTGSQIVFAQTQKNCVEEQIDPSRQTKRRRPNRRTTNCVPIESPATQTQQQNRAPAADGQSRQSVYEQSVYRQSVYRHPARTRKRNPVSPVPRPQLNDYVESVPLPDRWRIVDALGYEDNWYDPYHRNTLKADKPIHDDWFFNLGIISDTVYEKRELVTSIGQSSNASSGGNDVFGSSDQWLVNQNLAVEFVYYKGDTVFRPPDYVFRIIPVFNYNYIEVDELQTLSVSPGKGSARYNSQLALQAAYADMHLRSVSDRFDFDAVRVGIQPFNTDFRGFLFQDNQLGIRFFGNRNNNIFQYNLAFFQRLEKNTTSGLNDLSQSLRSDFVLAANLYWQDFLVEGFVSQFTVVHNKNSEDEGFYFDSNGFISRPASIGREAPRGYDVTYIGYSGDGHYGRFNLTTSLYFALGEANPGVFVDRKVNIQATFFAAEFSVDFDWIRPRLSFLYGSGDNDPFDDRATGFDAIQENPQFAGSDSSYWIRQSVPAIGGGRVALSSRNGVLNSLRSSKELGQSNFTNPGVILYGVGVDVDVLPELRFSANWNALFFDKTAVLEVARNQAEIAKDIGQDISFSLIYRPFMSQNIIVRASYAMLLPGDGYDDLFPGERADYFLLNLVLSY